MTVRKNAKQRGSASKLGVKRALDFTAAEDEDFTVPCHNLQAKFDKVDTNDQSS